MTNYHEKKSIPVNGVNEQNLIVINDVFLE
jgi:hypothetical protein